ncbi:hypothetical protein LTR81_026320 [Elasticomyces elasticus]
MVSRPSSNLMKRCVACFAIVAGLFYLRQRLSDTNAHQSTSASPLTEVVVPPSRVVSSVTPKQEKASTLVQPYASIAIVAIGLTGLAARASQLQQPILKTVKEQCVSENPGPKSHDAHQSQGRSAVLIRTWDTYQYQENDLQAIRPLVSELSLQSRGQYEVFLFVHVKDNSLPLWTDKNTYDDVLRTSVPREFQDMVVLWNEAKCFKEYPRVGTNEVYWQQWQPVQLFAMEHAGFEYIWNWEMDMRYIGHHLHFLSAITSFAAQEPRKYLWERSSMYYIPRLHGTWTEFSTWTASLIPPTLSVWGPVPSLDLMSRFAELPSSAAVEDDFKIGVGSEADLITSLPFFNPENTLWSYREKIWNYVQGARSPRRTYINTFSRMSRKLLAVMHEENKVGRSMVSEMWPASVALQYGFKAVYAPHPIWSSREWPVEVADAVFNPGSVVSPGNSSDAVYSPDREHNFGSMSWYFWSMFPGTLYRRFLGWDVKDEFGHVQELEKTPHNRICLPGMLLHPVKGVRFEDRNSFVP